MTLMKNNIILKDGPPLYKVIWNNFTYKKILKY